MIRGMGAKQRVSGAVRALGVMSLMGLVAAATTDTTRTVDTTQVSGDPELVAWLDTACLEYSQDAGESWGGTSEISWRPIRPVPGSESLHAEFLVRNGCEQPATLQAYAGAWNVTDGASATWRVELGEDPGEMVTLTGPSTSEDYGVLLNEVSAPTGEEIPVKLLLGIPWEETQQGVSIRPGWSLQLEEAATAPEAPTVSAVDPEAPTTGDVVTVSGLAEAGSTVEVTVDGEIRCTTTATEEGTFSCEVGEMAGGTHRVSATATNDQGTSEPAAEVEVTVEDAGTGWGSLDDLLNWGPLGSLIGSLTGDSGSSGSSGHGGSGSADGAEFGSVTGSMSESSLGEAGSTSFIEGAIGGGTVISGPAPAPVA